MAALKSSARPARYVVFPLRPLWNERGMPIDQHLLVAFTVTSIIAMIVPGPDMRAARRRIDASIGGMFVALGARLAVER